MPNECENEVSVYGSEAELKRFKEAITCSKGIPLQKNH